MATNTETELKELVKECPAPTFEDWSHPDYVDKLIKESELCKTNLLFNEKRLEAAKDGHGLHTSIFICSQDELAKLEADKKTLEANGYTPDVVEQITKILNTQIEACKVRMNNAKNDIIVRSKTMREARCDIYADKLKIAKLETTISIVGII